MNGEAQYTIDLIGKARWSFHQALEQAKSLPPDYEKIVEIYVWLAILEEWLGHNSAGMAHTSKAKTIFQAHPFGPNRVTLDLADIEGMLLYRFGKLEESPAGIFAGHRNGGKPVKINRALTRIQSTNL